MDTINNKITKRDGFEKQLVQFALDGDIKNLDLIIKNHEKSKYRLFKEIGSFISPIFSRYLSLTYHPCFIAACSKGNLEVIEYTINTKHIPFNLFRHLNLNTAFFIASENNQIKVIDYLSNHQQLKDNETKKYSPNLYLHTAVMQGHKEMVEYLLLSKNPIISCDIHSEDDRALIYSFTYNHLDIAKFLLYSDKIEEHANIHTQKDSIFKFLCELNDPQPLEFLIFEMNIDKTDEIKKLLQEPKYQFIEKMFEIRDLNINLNINLSGKKSVNSKQKKI